MDFIGKNKSIDEVIAIEEGVVNGGGCIYVDALLDNIVPVNSILGMALKAPMYRIVESCDIAFESIYQKLQHESREMGFDANTESIVNMYETGIIDPVKTVRLALLNAVSVAQLYLMTDCVIVPEEMKLN